jgi:hypothetical protein
MMTPTISLQSPLPLQNFATRGGNCQSDKNGLITNVIVGSQLMRDLINSGCAVIPNSAPSDIVQKILVE